MCSRNAAGLAHGTDDIALVDHVPGLYIDAAKVRIQADDALSMVEVDQIPAEEKITGINHRATGCGAYRRTFDGGNIKAFMRASFLFVKKTAQAEDAADAPGDRPDEVNIGQGIRSKGSCLFLRVLSCAMRSRSCLLGLTLRLFLIVRCCSLYFLSVTSMNLLIGLLEPFLTVKW